MDGGRERETERGQRSEREPEFPYGQPKCNILLGGY